MVDYFNKEIRFVRGMLMLVRFVDINVLNLLSKVLLRYIPLNDEMSLLQLGITCTLGDVIWLIQHVPPSTVKLLLLMLVLVV